MKYQTVRKLKEADYKFNWGYCSDSQKKLDECCGDNCTPTLDELIEKCGEGFASLHKTTKSITNLGLCIFIACPTDEVKYKKCIGSTPDEAVSLLWIELNI